MLSKITPENAHSFDRYSVINAMTVESARTCGCKAYESVFTYNRWRAMGYQVRKGEHGIKIGTFAPVTDKETKEIIGKRPWTSTVFCRCQVDKIVKN